MAVRSAANPPTELPTSAKGPPPREVRECAGGHISRRIAVTVTGPVDGVDGSCPRQRRGDCVEVAMVAAVGMQEDDSRAGSCPVHGDAANPEDPIYHAVMVHDRVVMY
jgi:hypothetical protein